MNQINQQIGHKIKGKRKKLGITQSDLSKRLSISPTYLNLMESGKRKIDLDEKTIWTLQERQALYYQNLFLISQKRLNGNRGPENILECEGGSYLDLQYKYRETNQ